MCEVSGCSEDAVFMTTCTDANCPDSDVALACARHAWMVCNPSGITDSWWK